MNTYTQKTATTPAVEMDGAEEKDFEGVADVEEQSDEDEDYDTKTEFLTRFFLIILMIFSLSRNILTCINLTLHAILKIILEMDSTHPKKPIERN